MSFKFFVRFAISLALLLFLFAQMNWAVLWHATIQSSLWFFILSVIFVLAQIVFLNLRWHRYLNCSENSVPFKISVLINVAGYFANVFFIASIGGILAKSGLAIRAGVPVVHSVIATLLDRTMTLCALVFFSLLGLPFLHHTLSESMFLMVAVSVGFIILGLVLAVFFLKSGWLEAVFFPGERKHKILSVSRQFINNNQLMFETVIYSVLAQGFFILSVYVLALGLDIGEVSAVQFLALMPILALISSLPISFGGWGVREGSFVVGLGLIGFSMEEAFLLSLQVGLVGMIAPTLVALPYFVQDNLNALLKKAMVKNGGHLG